MSEAVFTARGTLKQFREVLWLPLVLGMKHSIKELAPLLAILLKEGLISTDTNCHRFDKLIRDYEHAIITYMTCQIHNDLNIISKMWAAGNHKTVGQPPLPPGPQNYCDDGQACWLCVICLVTLVLPLCFFWTLAAERSASGCRAFLGTLSSKNLVQYLSLQLFHCVPQLMQS